MIEESKFQELSDKVDRLIRTIAPEPKFYELEHCYCLRKNVRLYCMIWNYDPIVNGIDIQWKYNLQILGTDFHITALESELVKKENDQTS